MRSTYGLVTITMRTTEDITSHLEDNHMNGDGGATARNKNYYNKTINSWRTHLYVIVSQRNTTQNLNILATKLMDLTTTSR